MSGLVMCADHRCCHYGTCYRAQAEPQQDQKFWALSPREGDQCSHYAPMFYTDGTSALREPMQ